MADFWENWLLWLPVALPTLLGLAVFALGERIILIRSILLGCALSNLLLSVGALLMADGVLCIGGVELLALDSIGGFFLLLANGLFLVVSLHVVLWLPKMICFKEWHGMHIQKERTLVGCLLIFIGMATLVTLSRNFGLLWVAIEATTMVTEIGRAHV